MNAQILNTRFAIVTVLLGLLVACGPEDVAKPRESNGSIRTLNWDELMPEGEEALLDQLYEEFYTDLDRRVMQMEPQTLSEAARNGDFGMIAEGSALDEMPQIGTFNTVSELDGLRVRIPGFIVPLDYERPNRVRNFLLVPYFGACIHMPPPPPNQLLYVTADPAVKINDLWEAWWAEGILSVERFDSDLGNSAYTLNLTRLKVFE